MSGRLQLSAIVGQLLVWLFVATLLAAEDIVVPVPREGFPGVYVDRSHEWLFAYDDLAIKMLTPIGFDVILSDCSLEAVKDLSRHDVVVLLQSASPAALSAEEEKLLLNYIKRGGNLLLVTNAKAPAERVARSLGFGFQTGGVKPLLATRLLVASGCPKEIVVSSVGWGLLPPKRATTLVTDAAGQPVAAALKYGKGRMVVWADDGAYWNFCAQRGPQGQVASTPANQALFRWIVQGRTGAAKGQLSHVEAEMVKEYPGLKVRYSKPIAPAAKTLIAKIPHAIEVVRRWNGQDLPSERHYTIHFLAGDGGGWAGPEAAGICVYGGDFPIRVMGHELTHSIANPLPGVFGEGWAIYVGQRAGEALGGAEAARAEQESILRRLDEVDPNRNKLDLMQSDQGPYNHDYQHKAVWMLTECQKRYGDDFMARVLKLRDTKYGMHKPVSLAQTLALFAEASNDPKIYDWYRSLGITAQP